MAQAVTRQGFRLETGRDDQRIETGQQFRQLLLAQGEEIVEQRNVGVGLCPATADQAVHTPFHTLWPRCAGFAALVQQVELLAGEPTVVSREKGWNSCRLHRFHRRGGQPD